MATNSFHFLQDKDGRDSMSQRVKNGESIVANGGFKHVRDEKTLTVHSTKSLMNVQQMRARLPPEKQSTDRQSLRFFDALDNFFHKKVLVFRQRSVAWVRRRAQKSVCMFSNVY